MDDGNVILAVQELQKKNNPDDTQTFISVGKRDNDGIEGDAEFDIYHDDVDWCE